MARRRQAAVAREEPIPEMAEDPPIDEAPEPVTAAVVEYPHCQKCGAVLALDDEKARGVCETCEPLQAVQGEDAPMMEAAPIDQPLPFPPAPVEPFDFHAAFDDIAKKNRAVESLERVYLELKERASDAKKQWEAAASSATLSISEYDRKAREAEAYAERQAELQAAYQEQLEAEAAKAAAPELPLEHAVQTAADRVPDLASTTSSELQAELDELVNRPGMLGRADQERMHALRVEQDVRARPETPLSDALPTCACGLALALDTERERGTCDACDETAAQLE